MHKSLHPDRESDSNSTTSLSLSPQILPEREHVCGCVNLCVCIQACSGRHCVCLYGGKKGIWTQAGKKWVKWKRDVLLLCVSVCRVKSNNRSYTDSCQWYRGLRGSRLLLRRGVWFPSFRRGGVGSLGSSDLSGFLLLLGLVGTTGVYRQEQNINLKLSVNVGSLCFYMSPWAQPHFVQHAVNRDATASAMTGPQHAGGEHKVLDWYWYWQILQAVVSDMKKLYWPPLKHTVWLMVYLGQTGNSRREWQRGLSRCKRPLPPPGPGSSAESQRQNTRSETEWFLGRQLLPPQCNCERVDNITALVFCLCFFSEWQRDSLKKQWRGTGI